MKRFDAIIVGQGLAGTTLALALRRLGCRVVIIDRGGERSASRVAAGLITPVTGQRMAASWRFAELFPVAESFYREVEQELGIRCFHRQRMVRLFVDEAERAAFEARAGTLLRGLVEPLKPWKSACRFVINHGGFEMTTAARLDVRAYLDATRARLEADGAFQTGEIDPATDIASDHSGVHIPRFNLSANWLIFCQGYGTNVLFYGIPFNAAKGEVLTLKCGTVSECPIVHKGAWFAPLEGDLALAGSTYERDVLDNVPTAAGRAQIEAKLRAMTDAPLEVIDHRAGVRPVLLDGRPILGMHPRFPRIGLFNGLGSKGALLAPHFAMQFANALLGRGTIDSEVSSARVSWR